MTYSVSGWRDSKVIDAESAVRDFSESWAAGWPARPTVRKHSNRRREMQRLMLQYWSQVRVVVKTSPSGVFFTPVGLTVSQLCNRMSRSKHHTSHYRLHSPHQERQALVLVSVIAAPCETETPTPHAEREKNVYISAPGATFLSWVPSSQTLWTCYDQHHTLSI